MAVTAPAQTPACALTLSLAASNCAAMLNSGSLALLAPLNVFLLSVWTAWHSQIGPFVVNVIVPRLMPFRYWPSTSVWPPFDFLQPAQFFQYPIVRPFDSG